MQIESLREVPQMGVVLALQRELSAARSEGELIYHFGRRFAELTGACLILDLDVAGLGDGRFRLRDRVAIDAPDFAVATARRHSRWDQAAEAVPVRTSRAISPLLNDADPKLARGIPSSLDPELLAGPNDQLDALAVPVYHAGRLSQWLVVLAPGGTPVDPVQLRTGVSNLNHFSRAVAQFRMRRHIESLSRRLELGLKEVALIQQSLLPKLPTLQGLDLAVHYRPAAIAGGDYYDFARFEGGRLGMVVADVAGHGPGAAVIMAMLRTIMSAFRLAGRRPDEVVDFANRLLVDGLSRGSFVTAVFVVLNPRNGAANYFNCGHCSPRVLRAGGGIDILDDGRGPPLGILPELDFARGEFRLQPGDSLCLFTDGIPEAPARAGRERFGYERLDRILARGGDPEELLQRLAEELDRFSGPTPRRDDECALLVTRSRNPC